MMNDCDICWSIIVDCSNFVLHGELMNDDTWCREERAINLATDEIVDKDCHVIILAYFQFKEIPFG